MSDRSSLQVRKLDNIIEELKLRKIHLLMMDIEGFEYRAINGLSLSLSKGVVEKIFCEVHPGMLAQDGSSDKLLIDKLENFGYSIEIIDKNKSAKSKPYHIQATLKR